MDIEFFVVGSQRCGTTWIDTALRSCNSVVLPKEKQTYFFDRNFENGTEWYFDQFDELAEESNKLVGEVATGYCLEGAIDRLADLYPNAKLILVVREPVSRAYSNYLKRSFDYPGMSFEQALDTNDDLVARGLYGEMLERMKSRFSNDQLKVLYFEDLQENAERFINEIFDFLDVEGQVDPSLFSQNINSSIFDKVVRLSKKYRFYFLVRLMKRVGLTAYARRLIFSLQKKRALPKFRISERVAAQFRESNEILEDHTGRSF